MRISPEIRIPRLFQVWSGSLGQRGKAYPLSLLVLHGGNDVQLLKICSVPIFIVSQHVWKSPTTQDKRSSVHPPPPPLDDLPHDLLGSRNGVPDCKQLPVSHVYATIHPPRNRHSANMPTSCPSYRDYSLWGQISVVQDPLNTPIARNLYLPGSPACSSVPRGGH